MKIKICGLTNLADARYCAAAGADFLGFIQYPGSPRHIPTAEARDIISWVHGPQTVGVFVNDDAETVNAAADSAGFDFVQLHGSEGPEVCERIERPVIKALRVAALTTADQLAAEAARYSGYADYVLLDTHSDRVWGGTGDAFNWETARNLSPSVFLAGGLTPDNVEQAIRVVAPYAVDVSSGVEESPGVKDFERVDQFIAAVRGAAE